MGGGTDTGKLERNSSFELLRILAMLLIIGHHLSWYGGGMSVDFSEGINRYISQFLFIGGNLGVDIFFILSGYFLVESKFRSKKLIRLDGAVLFYSIAAMLIGVFALHGHGDTISWLKAIFPITLQNYWFITVYAVVYLLSPLFNKAIDNLDKKHFTIIAAIMFFLVCIVPCAAFPMRISVLSGLLNRGIYGYFIGAYLQKYPIKPLDNVITAGLVFVFSYILLGIISVYTYKYTDSEVAAQIKDMFLAHESFLMIICASSAVMLFKNIKIGTCKPINFITQGILGVYVIHDATPLRQYLWNNIVRAPNVVHNSFYILYALKMILTIFFGCIAIELIRIYIIEKPLQRLHLLDNHCKKIDNFVNSI